MTDSTQRAGAGEHVGEAHSERSAKPSHSSALKTLALTNTHCEGEAQTASVLYI